MNAPMDDRSQRLVEEQRWYERPEREEGRGAALLRRILQSPLFYRPERATYAYSLIDRRLTALLREANPELPEGPLLNLPAGDGYDFPLLEGLQRRIVAADLSYQALETARERGPHPCVCCDSIRLPFPDSTFAVIVINKFLHHVVDDGFDPYLAECYRVLRPGGAIVIQEPSILYPVNLLTVSTRAVLRRMLGYELLGHVPHERAFLPGLLVQSLERTGFTRVRTEGSSFVHNRFPVLLGRALSQVQGPLLRAPGIRNFAWWILFSARKPASVPLPSAAVPNRAGPTGPGAHPSPGTIDDRVFHA